MALNRRQARLYTYKASIYRPQSLAPLSGDVEANEGLTDPTPAYTDISAYYKGTPEVDTAQAMGLTKVADLITFDEWHFEASQPLADTWIVQMTASDPARPPHPLIGRFWVIRDNPQVVGAQGRRNANFIMAFGVLSNLPGLSQKVNNIS